MVLEGVYRLRQPTLVRCEVENRNGRESLYRVPRRMSQRLEHACLGKQQNFMGGKPQYPPLWLAKNPSALENIDWQAFVIKMGGLCWPCFGSF